MKKVGSNADGSWQSLNPFEPNPCRSANYCFPMGDFLYFFPLEDDLDLDEGVEEERRR